MRPKRFRPPVAIGLLFAVTLACGEGAGADQVRPDGGSDRDGALADGSASDASMSADAARPGDASTSVVDASTAPPSSLDVVKLEFREVFMDVVLSETTILFEPDLVFDHRIWHNDTYYEDIHNTAVLTELGQTAFRRALDTLASATLLEHYPCDTCSYGIRTVMFRRGTQTSEHSYFEEELGCGLYRGVPPDLEELNTLMRSVFSTLYYCARGDIAIIDEPCRPVVVSDVKR